MSTKTFVGIGIVGLFVLFVLEHYQRKPAEPVKAVSTNTTSTNNPYLQAALSNALMRVRADLAKETNAAEIAKLRAAEHSITNTLK
jgi:hypothetical protein